MDIRTYRARTIHEAIELVRRDLGPGASVLHTREAPTGLFGRWLPGARLIEVTASAEVSVPSRLPTGRKATRSAEPTEARRPLEVQDGASARRAVDVEGRTVEPASDGESPSDRAEFTDDVRGRLNRLQELVEELHRRSPGGSDAAEAGERGDAGHAVWRELRCELAAADLTERFIESFMATLREDPDVKGLLDSDSLDLDALREQLAKGVCARIPCSGAIQLRPGQPRRVALVGPTGVGKTTTLAKLAAHFHLRERRKVALVTIDTFRIAAVEQLRTYAEIIDLPMHVVTTPREMRNVMGQLSDFDLVLIDSAGRSPADELKLQELRAFLAEGMADEAHLVLSATTSAASLQRALRQFAPLGPTALVLSKTDEAAGLWHAVPTLQSARLPLSYVTYGQNVPDDFTPASATTLSRRLAAPLSLASP